MATKGKGKILGITVSRGSTAIELDNDPSVGPLNNTWIIPLDHVNYNALVSLALAAAANRWTVQVRIEGDGEISSQLEARIRLMGVAW